MRWFISIELNSVCVLMRICRADIIGKTDCQLELLEPTRGTTLLVYVPPGAYSDLTEHELLNLDYNIDTNCLVSVIDSKNMGDDDTGFR